MQVDIPRNHGSITGAFISLGDVCPQETVPKKQTPPAQQARGSPQPEPSRRRHGPAVNLTKSLLRLRTLVRWCGFQV